MTRRELLVSGAALGLGAISAASAVLNGLQSSSSGPSTSAPAVPPTHANTPLEVAEDIVKKAGPALSASVLLVLPGAMALKSQLLQDIGRVLEATTNAYPSIQKMATPAPPPKQTPPPAVTVNPAGQSRSQLQQGGAPSSSQASADKVPIDVAVVKLSVLREGIWATIALGDLARAACFASPHGVIAVDPEIWDLEGRLVLTGDTQFLTQDDCTGLFSLFAPGFLQPSIDAPGAYRIGFSFDGKDGQRVHVGGPILVVTDDTQAAGPAEVTTDGPRPDSVTSDTYQTDPSNDALLRALAPSVSATG
jgi:hypothetical protein